MTDPPVRNASDEYEELPEDLSALDEAVGEALRESVAQTSNPALVDRVVAASAADLPGRTLPFSRPVASAIWSSPQMKAAAALLFVTGLVFVAWFATKPYDSSTVELKTPVAIEFQDQLGAASAEEVILVAILDGDGAWIEHESLDRPAAIEAEPVLRTRGTNVDDLADEINQILGTTS